MMSAGYSCRNAVCLILANHRNLRLLGNSRNSILLNNSIKCCGSVPFQETNHQRSTTAASTKQYVPQSSSQQDNSTNHSQHSYQASKPKKYFNFDLNDDSSAGEPQRRQDNLENNKRQKHTPKPRKASLHQLLHQAKHGHIQQAEKILQKLESSERFQAGVGLLMSLLGMYISAEQLPPALATLSRLHALYPRAALSTPTVLSLATLMLHDGQTNECIKLLADEAALIAEAAGYSGTKTTTINEEKESLAEADNAPPAAGKDDKSNKNAARSTVYTDKLCHSLLMVPATQGDVSTTESILEALLCNNYTKPSRAILGPLVQAHIARCDWDGALSTLQRLAQDHNCLPCRPELMKELARLKDTDRLQRVVELSAELLGHENAVLDLAVCFLESDDTKKAIELLQKMQCSLSPARLQYLCQYYARHDNTRCLRHLVTVVRTCGSPGDLQLVCAHLIRVYDEKRESGRAAELLQAEGLTREDLPALLTSQTSGAKQTASVKKTHKS